MVLEFAKNIVNFSFSKNNLKKHTKIDFFQKFNIFAFFMLSFSLSYHGCEKFYKLRKHFSFEILLMNATTSTLSTSGRRSAAIVGTAHTASTFFTRITKKKKTMCKASINTIRQLCDKFHCFT